MELELELVFTCNNKDFTEPSACCRVSSLVMVCRRSFAAKASLLAIETALLTRRQQSADHKDNVCQVGMTMNTAPLLLALIGFFLRSPRTPKELSCSLDGI